jgi:hypothetical protein
MQKRRDMPSVRRKAQTKKCKAQNDEHKCINSMMYNKYNENKSIYVNHTSLERKCPSMQAITKYTQNTDY